MKPKNASHRTKADRQKAREMFNLKSENQQLKRQVARLQREVEKWSNIEPVEGEEVEAAPKKKKNGCQNCGETTFKELQIPNGSILKICMACKDRTVL
jgi:formylmethanofuran dehydrogenase subunit E